MTNEQTKLVELGTVYENLLNNADFKVLLNNLNEMKIIGLAKVLGDGYDDQAVRRGFENRGRIKMIDHIKEHILMTVEQKNKILSDIPEVSNVA